MCGFGRDDVAQGGFATSVQRSAFSTQLLNPRREHAFYLGGFADGVVAGAPRKIGADRKASHV